MKKLLVYLDYLVRGISLCGLVPLGFLGLVLSIMATDSGTVQSMIGAFAMLGVVGLLISLIALSAIIHKDSTGKLPKIFRNIIVVRLPAYIFALPSIWLVWNVWLKHQL